MKKNLPLHDTLDHFVFLYFSTACLRRRLLYITKDDSSEGLKQLNQEGANPGPMEKLR